MKSFTQTQKELLNHLSDGRCHSGSALGDKIGISRTAIWKQITQLNQLGLGIERIAQQGYRLNHPLILLDEKQIHNLLLEEALDATPEIMVCASIDSTNRYLKDLPSGNQIRLCAAETQTQGRGRFGRSWFSPCAQNICFSMRFKINCCLSKLSSLSLVIGLAIIKALGRFELRDNIGIKWPNDIYWKNKKLCGILIEVIAESNGDAEVIIGIGMNVNTDTSHMPLNQGSWCSLHEITGRYYDRNRLIAFLYAEIYRYMQRFLDSGFHSFLPEWQSRDYLAEKIISVSQPLSIVKGRACGVNELGQLGIETEKGEKIWLSSGDTSVNQSL